MIVGAHLGSKALEARAVDAPPSLVVLGDCLGHHDRKTIEIGTAGGWAAVAEA